MNASSVDFHFDIMCPYAYQTSLWIRDVRDQLGLDVRWRFFSLEEVNRRDGKKHPWERQWSYGWSMMRVAAMLRRIDQSLVDQWYHVAGAALHVQGLKPDRREVAEQLVADMGLDPSLVARAVGDPTTNDEVKEDHDRVVALEDGACRHWFSRAPRLCLVRSSSIRPPEPPQCASGNPSPPGSSFHTSTKSNAQSHGRISEPSKQHFAHTSKRVTGRVSRMRRHD